MSSRAAATSPAATRGKKTERDARPRARLTPRAAVLVFSVFIVTMFSVAPIRAYLEQRARLDGLARQASSLERQNQVLRERIEDLNDPRTLERLARECLGMVRPGEIAFVAIPRGRAPVPPKCG
ncbi:MAG: FtsB family cell division protein [Actinomycetota bacterium]